MTIQRIADLSNATNLLAEIAGALKECYIKSGLIMMNYSAPEAGGRFSQRQHTPLSQVVHGKPWGGAHFVCELYSIRQGSTMRRIKDQ